MNRDDDLQHYLNSACTGLFGLERQTVRGELEANLFERVREFQVMGFAQEVALEKALEEFGAPSSVSRGMREVYIMPKVMKGGALAGLLAMGVYLAVGSSVAGPVNVTYDGPCKENCVWMGQSYVSVNSLERELKAQGVKVTRDAKVLWATFPNGARGRVTVQLNAGGDSSYAIFKRGSDTYTPVNQLLALAYGSKAPVYLSSLTHPTLSMGKVKLSLENAAQPINLSYQMSELVAEWLCKSSKQADGYNPFNPKISLCPDVSATRSGVYTPVYRVKLGKPRTLFAVLLPQTPIPEIGKLRFGISSHRVQVLETDRDGILTFRDTRFVTGGTDIGKFAPTLATSAREFANGKSGKALLLELTGRLDFGGQNYRVVSAIPTLEKLK